MNEEILKELDKILSMVVRVHGEHHPELREVECLYRDFKAAPGEETAARLREAARDFVVPEDACPTYARAYKDLDRLTRECV